MAQGEDLFGFCQNQTTCTIPVLALYLGLIKKLSVKQLNDIVLEK